MLSLSWIGLILDLDYSFYIILKGVDFLKSIIREPVNAFTHLGGAAIFLLGTIILFFIAKAEHILSPNLNASIWIFGLSLVALYTSSGVYHALKVKEKTLVILRKLDHSMIFILIAGSYTPFCLLSLTGFWCWGLLSIIWTLAILGVGMKLLWIGMPRKLSTALYMGMGWISIFAAKPLFDALPLLAFVLLALGGIMYTIGGIIYGIKKPNIAPHFGFHELFHVFCLLGSGFHFAAVASYLI